MGHFSVMSMMDAKTLMGISIGAGCVYALQMFTNKHPMSEDGSADQMYFPDKVDKANSYRGWFGLAIAQSAALQCVYFQTTDTAAKDSLVKVTAALWATAAAKFSYHALVSNTMTKDYASMIFQGGMAGLLGY